MTMMAVRARPDVTSCPSALTAREPLAVQDMNEFVRDRMFVWRRSTTGLEDLDDKDVVDRISLLVEKHHEVVGIRRRNPERLRVCNVCGTECHAKLPSISSSLRLFECPMGHYSR